MLASKVSMSQLHRNTGVPIANIQRMLHDPDVNPTISSIKPIADFFNLTVNQLIGDEPLSIDKNSYIEKVESWVKIPIISWEQATRWNLKKIKSEKFVKTDIEVSAQTCALEIEDDDYEGFNKGSIIIVDYHVKPDDRDYILVKKEKEKKASLKQYLYYEGKAYLKPVKKLFEITPYDNSYKILGVVLQVKKDLKTT